METSEGGWMKISPVSERLKVLTKNIMTSSTKDLKIHRRCRPNRPVRMKLIWGKEALQTPAGPGQSPGGGPGGEVPGSSANLVIFAT